MVAHAAEDRLKKFHHPVEARDFETLCEDVFEFVLQARNISVINPGCGRIGLYGKSGDSQHGIDIRDPATLSVAQCKKQRVISCKMLEAELEKLKGYKGGVSHYFFMVSEDFVGKTLIEWIEKQNALNIKRRRDSFKNACEPAVAMPELHIVGWNEIRGYLAQSTHLLWKWGFQVPPGCDFSFSPAELRGLAEVIESLEKPVDLANFSPNHETVDAIQSLISKADLVEIKKLGRQEIVDASVVDWLRKFVEELRKVFQVGQKFDEAMRKVKSRDLVVSKEGYLQLNELMLNKARLSAYPVLRGLYFNSKRLLRVLSEDGISLLEPEEIEGSEGVVDVEGYSKLRFNFTKKGRYYGVYYTNPKIMVELASKVSKGLRGIKPYIKCSEANV
ncbi:hypothetical protein [Pseudomonas sp. yb_9]|uniref:hypothetical protein n=1 Tax=Pseudomonas sp. yb_9 TaxID=3367222 RepID=UPI00370A0693